MNRPAKPTSQHIKQGTFRKDRHSSRLDTQDGLEALGEPPDRLNDEARAFWIATVAAMPGTFRQADAPLLEGAARWWASWLTVTNEMEKTEPTAKEYFRLNQMAAIAWKQFSTAAAKLGLSPSDRASLKVTTITKEQPSALDQLRLIGAKG